MNQTIKINVDKHTVKQTINIIKSVFHEHHEQLKQRTLSDQTTIGNVLTIIEMDLKRQFNAAASTGSFDCDIELAYKLEDRDRETEQAVENMVPKVD